MNMSNIITAAKVNERKLKYGLLISLIMLNHFGCAPSDPTESADPSDPSNITDTTEPTDRTPPSESDNLYLDWFADYNQDHGTEYLEQTGVVFEDGDVDRYPDAAEHTFIENIAYGPFSRNVFDLYLPKNVAEPTPIVLYLHGGGFSSGDKDKVHGGKGDIAEYLRQGIAVATANYRYGSGSIEAAMSAEHPNGICDGTDGGCRKDYVFRDGARVIQYLRYASDIHNIDPNRIGLWGSSAGGQIALWVATVPDLAITDHPDPVLQQSTRVQAVGHLTSQVSALNSDWKELLEFSDDFWESLGLDSEGFDKLLHDVEAELRESEEGQKLIQVLDYYRAITADDPPMITAGVVRDYSEEDLLNPANADDAQGWFVHHPQHSTPIYEKCLSVQKDCAIATALMMEGDHVDSNLSPSESIQSFLTYWLTKAD